MQKQAGIAERWRNVALLLLMACGTSRRALAQHTPDELFASASPAVAKLIIKDDDERQIGTGSGFIIPSDKLSEGMSTSTVITNYHVVYPAVFIGVLFQDKGTGGGNRVLVEDPSADIAALEVWSSYRPEQVLKLCAGEGPAIGTKVFTIGSPLGLTNTLSEGLVSGYRERDDGSRWMQISAPISPGSSGGPVLSVDGCVLGMTTATTKDGQNLNFAIAAKDILRVLNAPKKDRNVSEGASLRLVRQFAEWRAEWRLLTLSGRSEVEAQREASDLVYRGDCKNELLQKGVRESDQLALFLTAQCLSANKRDDEALPMFKRAADAKPCEFAYLVHYTRAMAILEDGRKGTHQAGDYYPQAISALVKSRDLQPDFAPTRYELGFARYVYSLYSQQQYPEALLEADAVVRLVPRCPKGYMLRGAVWAKLGRREAFERDFEKAIELRPRDYTIHEWKASGYDDLGDLVRAIEVNRRAIELAGDEYSAAHYNIINQLATVGQCEDAFEHFQKARLGELTPDNPYALQILKCRARAEP